MQVLPRPKLLLAALLFAAAAGAGDEVFRLTMRASYDSDKTFTFVAVLTRDQGDRLVFDQTKEIKPWQLECRKALAKKLGYHPQIYGDTYHTLVSVQKYRYDLTDLRSGRVVLEERR